VAHAEATKPEKAQEMAVQKILAILWAKTAKDPKRVYQVQRVSAIGNRRYVKIRADANPYLQEYAAYFWRRRNDKESKRLGLMSACELRAMKAA